MRLIVLSVFIVLVNAKHEKYIGWKAYNIGPSNVDQLKSLDDLTLKYDLDFLSPVTTLREGLVLVQPKHQNGFIKELTKLGVLFKIHANDVKEQLDADDQFLAALRLTKLAKTAKKESFFDDYQDLNAFYAYMEDIAAGYPDIATLETAGFSFEGRPIKYMKISTTNFQDSRKPVVFIDGGISPREWISPPTVTWIIKSLVENVTDFDLLENFDWILVPIVNPDGYEFSVTTTRFWMKTRSTDTHEHSYLCPGVHAGRNFDFYWNTQPPSNDPCRDTYTGNRAFSELETQAIRNLLHEHLARIALYISMRSYGSMITYPWNHAQMLSNNAFALHTIGIAMAEAIHEVALPDFFPYQVGNAFLVHRSATSGTPTDYAHSIGVPLTFTFELPATAWGLQGFHLDPELIKQVCFETWKGVAVGARRAGDLVH